MFAAAISNGEMPGVLIVWIMGVSIVLCRGATVRERATIPGGGRCPGGGGNIVDGGGVLEGSGWEDGQSVNAGAGVGFDVEDWAVAAVFVECDLISSR